MTTKHTSNNHDLYRDIANIKAALAEATDDLKGKAGQILTNSMDDIKEQSSAVKENIVDYTAEKPFKTLGIALLVGLAIGYFIRK